MNKFVLGTLNINILKVFLLLVVAIAFKLIPHLPNFSPELTFSIYLLTYHKKHVAIISMLAMWLLSDIGYALLYHVPIFGSWMIGTYSALLLLVLFLFVFPIKQNNIALFASTILGSSFFWLWTNFGVWLFSGMYTHTFLGLINCYVLALPFLGYAIFAAVFWSVVLVQKPVKCFLSIKNNLHITIRGLSYKR